ncbi:hypothetical protein C5O19_02835 [Siphonobacter curvatus]|uniref:Uncharacterized protein n=2 Tax=Siphonobacter curvatus TaxID=2094562 RepID=A0A2S7ILL5_9BACT|nr:hypothetical protein C5O19_02835 [Siphonobacter curvatus]
MFSSQSVLKLFSSSGFLLVLLCFFFNFMTISCNDEPVAIISGWTLVKGGKPDPVIPKWTEGLSSADIEEFGQNGNAALTQSRRVPMQPAAAAVILCCALGLGVSWAPKRMAPLGSLLLSGLSLVALGILHYHLSDFDTILDTASADLNPLNKEDLQFIRLFAIHWDWAYWLAVTLLALIFGNNLYHLLRKR